MKKLMKMLKKKKYYYVQKCPKCSSRVTGRYLPRPRYETDAIYLERNSLIHGELIQLVDYDIFNNCYCEDCGYEWRYDVIGRLISPERFAEEQSVRKTKERLMMFNEEHPVKKKGFLKSAFSLFPRY